MNEGYNTLWHRFKAFISVRDSMFTVTSDPPEQGARGEEAADGQPVGEGGGGGRRDDDRRNCSQPPTVSPLYHR